MASLISINDEKRNFNQHSEIDENIALNEYFCHHCSNKAQVHQLLACSNKNCSNKYCIFCINNFYYKNKPFVDISQEHLLLKCWVCPLCEKKCICEKCTSNKISTKTKNESQNSKCFLGKKISSDAELIMWLSTGENENTSIDKNNIKFPFIPSNSKIKSKVYDKLIKIAKQCELFFRHKCKNEYIKKNCSNCYEINYHQNDLLRFFNYEIFLYYMKYLFLIQNKIIGYSKENFKKNKNDFEELFTRFKSKKEIWAFNETKIICKKCIFLLINKPCFFEKIKAIFLSQTNNALTPNNKNDLKEENNIDSINNEIDSTNISNNIFKIIKIPKNDFINDNKNNNIKTNYNNHNLNIFDKSIFNIKNENTFIKDTIFNEYSLLSHNKSPLINNLNNSSINFNYIQILFLELKKEMAELLEIVKLSKKEKNISMFYSIIESLNQKILKYFLLIEMSVTYNINFLNSIILHQNINIIFEYINLSNRILEFINKNRNFLFLFNELKINYMNLINNFILAK